MMKDSLRYSIQEYSSGSFTEKEISSILEIPLTINLNGREVVTLLTTARFPDYLAIGFLKSDAYISSRDQVTDLKITEYEDRIIADVSTSHDPWEGRVLEYSITSGCGKGTNFGRNVSTISKRTIKSELIVTPDQILKHAEELHSRSALYNKTRGCHNSSLCTPEEMLYFREDIGRHNAIDMIVGQCFLEDVPTDGKMIVSTGRVASEILLKAVRIGVPILASTAVATSFSVELARKIGITLIGNISKDGFWIYNDQGRIKGL
ncbi:formate dehydrogenase accessory sulfurtransferase FdhD [Maridesulfovibrio sp.]|uniref:formate dehydrogenase accessory sulfurtransferase FdhD n=1 Tax=Maridesulfovibrio sp. TaxID=2795000 RepID=UPI0029CA81F0|nr:formate dehydrogenase accessory sulfurtransferase FdhD [Maridesulfovibrio sp.]